MVNDNTPISGDDINPESDFSKDDQVFNSSGKIIPTPPPMCEKASAIYKKICKLVRLGYKSTFDEQFEIRFKKYFAAAQFHIFIPYFADDLIS